MAGFKRGGSRGGGGAYKKGFTKKRAAPDDEDSAPRAGKKTKGDDEDEEDATSVVPELKTNEDGDRFVGVSLRHDERTYCFYHALTSSKLSAGGKRRITIREFKNSLLLDVREYWTNDAGELKPGKKVWYIKHLGIRVTNTSIQGHLAESRPIQHTCCRSALD
jgi:hypothetical protein